jgi:MOSC domain-containing protein YiiM
LAENMRAWARTPFEGGKLEGKPSFHLDSEGVDAALNAAEQGFVLDESVLESIVVRGTNGARGQPLRTRVTVNGGLEGDRWAAGEAHPGDQLSMMNVDVAAAFANGQSIALFGDNLFTRLDLREASLGAGARLRIGSALVEVSATPHVPCNRFKGRFGDAAFRAAARDVRLRGIYLTVVEGGAIAIGDPIRVG